VSGTASSGWQQQQQPVPCDEAALLSLQRGLRHTGFREASYAQALLEAHYSVHAAFLQAQPLLAHVDAVRHIPCIAVQGQADLVCPPTTAVELSAAWPEAEVRLVPRAGHSMYDPPITHELVAATDRMRALAVAGVGGAAAGVR
jgi:proline iminopeptidase